MLALFLQFSFMNEKTAFIGKEWWGWQFCVCELPGSSGKAEQQLLGSSAAVLGVGFGVPYPIFLSCSCVSRGKSFVSPHCFVMVAELGRCWDKQCVILMSYWWPLGMGAMQRAQLWNSLSCDAGASMTTSELLSVDFAQVCDCILNEIWGLIEPNRNNGFCHTISQWGWFPRSSLSCSDKQLCWPSESGGWSNT